MGIVAVCGDAATTTAVALTVGWPAADDVILVEADPSGGDLAAWFDLPVEPSLSTLVTRVRDGAWPDIEGHTRIAANGIRLLPAPSRAVEASQAVAESSRSIVPSLAALRSPVTIADAGRLPSIPVADSTNPFLGASAAVVAVHRQATQSARASAVRLERFADHVTELTRVTRPVIAAILGGRPFDLDEIERFLGDAGPAAVVALPDDPLAAAVFAGRTGVSERRLSRLPLVSAGRHLAAVVERAMSPTTGSLWRSAR